MEYGTIFAGAVAGRLVTPDRAYAFSLGCSSGGATGCPWYFLEWGLFVVKRGAGADVRSTEESLKPLRLAAVKGKRVRRLQVHADGRAADVVMFGLDEFRVLRAGEVNGEVELVVETRAARAWCPGLRSTRPVPRSP